MTKRDIVVLKKIISETEMLSRMLAGVNEHDFLLNEEKMRSTCMTLINIGELVKNFSEDFRLSNNHLPWKDIAGLRDVAAHGYFTLKMEDIWIYASTELPGYLDQFNAILEENGCEE